MKLRKLSPADQQKEWLRNPAIEPISMLQELLGGSLVNAIPILNGGHAIYQIFVSADFDVLQDEEVIRHRLDGIDWEWVTLNKDENGRAQKVGFGIAPIRLRQLKVAYHATLKEKIPNIRKLGLLPSSSVIQQTDFPDTVGRIHVAESLSGDGGAVRWIRIFSEKYNRPQSAYGILSVDLQGIGGRQYQDVHSQHGIVIDRVAGIDPSRIQEMHESMYTLESESK
jgi:hypothetical protein